MHLFHLVFALCVSFFVVHQVLFTRARSKKQNTMVAIPNTESSSHSIVVAIEQRGTLGNRGLLRCGLLGRCLLRLTTIAVVVAV
jgi:hypothetical protein